MFGKGVTTAGPASVLYANSDKTKYIVEASKAKGIWNSENIYLPSKCPKRRFCIEKTSLIGSDNQGSSEGWYQVSFTSPQQITNSNELFTAVKLADTKKTYVLDTE